MPGEINLPIPDVVLDRWRSVLDATTTVVGADAGNLSRISGADLELLLITGRDRHLYRLGERMRFDTAGLYRGRIAQALVLSDAVNDIGWRRKPDVRRDMSSYVGLPLVWPSGAPFGTIDFHFQLPKRLDETSERFFALIRDLFEDSLARIFADNRRAEIERQQRIEIDRMSLAAAAGGAGVWDFNLITGALHCDDRWYDILGLDLSHRIRSVDDFKQYIHPEDADAATRVESARVAELFQKGHPYSNFFRIVRPNGEVRWVTSTARLIGAAQTGPTRAVGVLSDITEQHLAHQRVLEAAASLERMVDSLEQAKSSAVASEQEKSALLATVSHDIRTPLTSIVGVLQLLQRESLSPRAGEMVRDALSCSEMLTHLLNDVLDLSRVEAGKLEFRLAPVNVADMVSGITRLLAPEADAKGIFLAQEIGKRVGWVMADPVRLKQCVFNLVGNAVKFTAEGGVTIRAFEVRRGHLRIEVEDTGVGIPPKDQPRLFQRFEQGGAARGGTGLGLSITHALAQQMGGDVGFSSLECSGSTFWFEFNAPRSVAPKQPQQPEPDTARAPLEGVSILLVEDNLRNRQIFVGLLEAFGAAITPVGTGLDAIDMFSKQRFDVVLMDIEMPDMDGIEATQNLRALPREAQASTPIIALTAGVMEHERQRYLAAGMNDVIPKPVTPTNLLQTIQRSIGKP